MLYSVICTLLFDLLRYPQCLRKTLRSSLLKHCFLFVCLLIQNALWYHLSSSLIHSNTNILPAAQDLSLPLPWRQWSHGWLLIWGWRNSRKSTSPCKELLSPWKGQAEKYSFRANTLWDRNYDGRPILEELCHHLDLAWKKFSVSSKGEFILQRWNIWYCFYFLRFIHSLCVFFHKCKYIPHLWFISC